VVAAEGYPPASELPGMLRGVYAQPASTYAPSILLDMEECRPTEGEHPIGDLVDRATPRGIAVPILTCVRALSKPIKSVGPGAAVEPGDWLPGLTTRTFALDCPDVLGALRLFAATRGSSRGP